MQINNNIHLFLINLKKVTRTQVDARPVLKLTNKYCHSLDVLYLLVNFGLVEHPICNYKDYSQIKKGIH